MENIITDSNYESIVAEGLPVVVDFSATWCGPCKKIAPIIEKLAVEYQGRVNIGKCDVDDNEELTSKFGIRNVPTVIFIKMVRLLINTLVLDLKKNLLRKLKLY